MPPRPRAARRLAARRRWTVAALAAVGLGLGLGVDAAPVAADDGGADQTVTGPTPPGGALAPAPAPVDQVIGLLDVRVGGVGPTASELLTRQIADAVTRAGYIVVLPARLREVMASTPWNTACLIGWCLVDLDRHAAVGRVLEAGLFSVGANFDYVVTLVDTARGVPIAQIQRTCDVCNTDEALAAPTAAAVELVQSAAHLPVGEGLPRPARRPPPPPPRPRSDHRRWKRPGLLLLGGAFITGVTGAIVRGGDHGEVGAGLIGAAATLAVAGGTCLALSFDF